MKIMRKFLTTLLMGTSVSMFSCASAAPNNTDDFSYSATLSEAKTSLRQINLPDNVYEKMQRQDYGDLRIFSADGQIVPHQFRHSYQQQRINSQQETPLVFYPFSKEQAANPSSIQVTINQKTGEQNLSINQQLANNQQSPKINEYQYILINKAINNGANNKQTPSLCKLKLDWQQSKPSSILNFKLESSNQLQNWRTLSRKLTVSKLDYAGSQLKQDEVKFPCTSQKYLRLTWSQPDQKTRLVQAKGIYTQKGAKKTHWSSLGKPRYNAKDKTMMFDLNRVASISKLDFIIPQDGLLYKGTLYSRNNEKSKWRYRSNVSQYQLNMGDTTLQSSPITFSPSSDRYWKIELSTQTTFSENQLPEISAGWIPSQLYFLAQGNGPFKIAFGNPTIKPVQNNSLNSLIESIKRSHTRIDQVSLGEIANSNKSFEAESKTPWKLILLWIFLILGTGLMGFMAYRLFQQMGDE
jgi:hypothetical protein